MSAKTFSSLTQVQPHLRDLLQTALGPDVVVSSGPPASKRAAAVDQLNIVKVEGTTDWASMGTKQREQQWDVVCVLSALKRGGSHQSDAAYERAMEMWVEVDQAIRNDPTLGGRVMWALSPATFTVEWGWPDNSDANIICEVTFTVRVRERIVGL